MTFLKEQQYSADSPPFAKKLIFRNFFYYIMQKKVSKEKEKPPSWGAKIKASI